MLLTRHKDGRGDVKVPFGRPHLVLNIALLSTVEQHARRNEAWNGVGEATIVALDAGRFIDLDHRDALLELFNLGNLDPE